jgi:hypothetical protein
VRSVDLSEEVLDIYFWRHAGRACTRPRWALFWFYNDGIIFALIVFFLQYRRHGFAMECGWRLIIIERKGNTSGNCE